MECGHWERFSTGNQTATNCWGWGIIQHQMDIAKDRAKLVFKCFRGTSCKGI